MVRKQKLFKIFIPLLNNYIGYRIGPVSSHCAVEVAGFIVSHNLCQIWKLVYYRPFYWNSILYEYSERDKEKSDSHYNYLIFKLEKFNNFLE